MPAKCNLNARLILNISKFHTGCTLINMDSQKLADIISTKGPLGRQFLERPKKTRPLILQTTGGVQTANLGRSTSKLSHELDQVITKHVLLGKEYPGPAYFTVLRRRHFWENDGAPVSVMLDIPKYIAARIKKNPAAMDGALIDLPKLVGSVWKYELCSSGDADLARLQWFYDHLVAAKEEPRAGTFGALCEGQSGSNRNN